MAKKNNQHYSGIGGQAILEGVMMKNKDKYAVAVRKEDGEIAILTDSYQGVLEGSIWCKIPLIRGVINFIDSLKLGSKSLNISASYFDEEDSGEGQSASDKLIVVLAILFAIGLFVVLPTFVASRFEAVVQNMTLLAVAEGAFRILIFFGYLMLISLMKDIRRVFMYHGAEHKCINCLENGKELTLENVRSSSRFHRRCGTSFLFFVVFISVVLFFFIRIRVIWLRMVIRLALVPVIAGISYEILRLAGRSDNFLIRVISAPGLLIQRLTTKEPDDSMIEVAICSVEAVFNWRQYLAENFGKAELAEAGEGNANDDIAADASATSDDDLEDIDPEKLRAELLKNATENLRQEKMAQAISGASDAEIMPNATSSGDEGL